MDENGVPVWKCCLRRWIYDLWNFMRFCESSRAQHDPMFIHFGVFICVHVNCGVYLYRYMCTLKTHEFFPYAWMETTNGRTSIKVKERRAHTLGSLKKRKVSCKGRLSGPAVRMGGNGDGMMGWDAKKRQKISKWSIEIAHGCLIGKMSGDVRWCHWWWFMIKFLTDELWFLLNRPPWCNLHEASPPNPPQASAKGSKQRNQ